MDWKSFLTVFASVFLAELGDKTQLATLLFAADEQRSKWQVFAAAALALCASAAIAVLAGSFVGLHVDAKLLRRVAGLAFIAIGVWTLIRS